MVVTAAVVCQKQRGCTQRIGRAQLMSAADVLTAFAVCRCVVCTL